jgi:hypothetical protein
MTTKDRVLLGERLDERGYGIVEYSNGGWSESLLYTSAPHLKFGLEEDAIAYSLAFGGTVTSTVPRVEKKYTNMEGGR